MFILKVFIFQKNSSKLFFQHKNEIKKIYISFLDFEKPFLIFKFNIF